MVKPVTITIRGPEDGRADAPSVDDLLGQIRDLVDVLRGVERATEANGKNELEWRVTDARMNSPISLELTPFGHGPADAILARIDRVERTTANGFRALRAGHAQPPFFNNETLGKARKMHARVLNGLTDTLLAFDVTVEAAPVVIDAPAARKVERAIEVATAAESAPYREFGSVEGYVTKPELDGHGRAILRFRARLGGAEVKAYASGDAFHQVEALRLSDVWHGVRVRVYGVIHYKSLGVIEVINATGMEVLDRDPLPGLDDIIDPNFSSGLTTEEFLRELRHDG
ncbi:hypothetical protein [Sphingomonas colocasiae]|uniref:Uncharacterized protein n=1 Tax=Sphingomonas colocasiae TaxID=1848973 RepID=A0ABS7PLM3_9SPHN|nr:hypothetical protein [Sphingomonas colocasiae]MBY8822215.1 hypothetical protein [Sphingomonas colocasiae]